ncbi:MAG: hypothetical protein KatS3mg040_0151 [Candidatus Kapaibacterium sp.]|nr:MAG: hypothetical protein KatS3mg040_0151 [Candidatus Kapabacteria bacterium]
MRLLLALLVCSPACMFSALASDTLVALPVADIRVHLPHPDTIALGAWSLAHYSTPEMYSFELAVPTVRPTTDAPTALQVRYGDSLAIFIAAVPEFLSTVDLLGRMLDLVQLRRSSNAPAPLMITDATQRLVGLAPAEEISIELRDTTANDSLFTLITSAKRGQDVALVIVRSRNNPRTLGTASNRTYRQILASIAMDNLIHRDTTLLVHPTGWKLGFPKVWMEKVSTTGSTPLFLPDRTDDSLWNTVAVQLPLVRIDYTVAQYHISDSAMAEVVEHIAERKGLEQWSPPSESRLGKLTGTWYRTLAPRRGDTVQTTYGVFFARGWLATIQLVAWERDMEHVGTILPALVGMLHLPVER